MVQADHLAASVSLGVHGRRRAGMGESFWQFRRYASHDSSSAIDWRQSAKSQHIFVREREWEAAQTVWFWRDASANMNFKSGATSKRARADLLLLALASLLVRGGERVGFVGMEGAPASSRLALTRMGRAMFSGKQRGAAAAHPLQAGQPAGLVQRLSGRRRVDSHEAPVARRAWKAIWCGSWIRRKRISPIPAAPALNPRAGGEDEIFGRAERIRNSYRARFTAHGEQIAEAAMKLGWTCTVHRTDHTPQISLIALHAAIGGT